MTPGVAKITVAASCVVLTVSMLASSKGAPSVPWESSPVAIDWNGDGLMDLVVGDDDGYISLFLGAGGLPTQFSHAGLFRVASSNEHLWVGKEAHPEVTDWDGDGILDLIVGDDVGYVTLFLGQVPGSLAVAPGVPVVLASGCPLRVQAEARPRCVDWNGDEADDLVVGTNSDGLYIYLNMGSNQDRVLADGIRPRSTLGEDLRFLHPVLAPWVGDWDLDGLPDLVIGCSVPLVEPDATSSFPCCEGLRGHLFFYRNVGTVATPLFLEGVLLKANSRIIDVGDSAAPYAFDWTGDGLLDLVVGSNSGEIWFFEREDAGVCSLKAVPDGDADGVSDPHDMCPDWPGSPEMSGC